MIASAILMSVASREMSFSTIDPPTPVGKPRASNLRHLVAALVLIGLAITGLGLYDRLRERPVSITAPHEPSMALIAADIAQAGPPTASVGQAMVEHTQQARIVAAEAPAPFAEEGSVAPPPPSSFASSSERAATHSEAVYVVQVGVFNSPANAQALQNQLRRAGLEARLETRVQIGPFKDKREANQAIARAKKLGINAILVKSR